MLRATGTGNPGGAVGTSLFAALPAASGFPFGTSWLVTDLGSSGAYMVSNGTSWSPLNGVLTLACSGVGYLLPGLSAASNVSLTSNVATVINGAPTAHNIPAATFDGYNVFFPGSANIPAGWYPTFARTSVNNYTFAFTHGNVASESVNAAAAYLTETTAVTITLPGGAMGLNGAIRPVSQHDWLNSAGVKTIKFKFGGSFIINQAPTTTTAGRFEGLIQNAGSASKQVVPGGAITQVSPAQTSGTSNTVLAINTAVDVALLYTLQCAAATDWVTLGPYYIELRR